MMVGFRKVGARNVGVAGLMVTAAIVGLPGCGGSPSVQEELKGLHPVKGTIKSNVGSVAGMTIHMFPNSAEARESSGEVKADGTFELFSRKPGDGASDGDYKIYFSKPIGGGKAKGSFPEKFLSPDTTDAKATIKPETSDLGTITLRR